MESVKGSVKLVSAALGACMLLLLSTGAVEADEQVSYSMDAKLVADDGSVQFGTSVALSDDTAVIGAEADNELGFLAGAAYLFQRDPLDPTLWTQTAKLTADDGANGDTFGNSVAISGDTAVIGAEFDDDFGFSSGSAYIFVRDPLDPTVWTQTAKLTADDGAQGDHFGNSVAISGDTAVIGAEGDRNDLGTNSGSVYVFHRDPLDPTLWTQTAKLTAADGAERDGFGISVAIFSDTAVIGAPFDDDLGDTSGSAYVFQRDPLGPTVWTQTAKLTADDGAADDSFGESIAISGDTAVIGAEGDDDLGTDSGSAYVFRRDPFDPTLWSQTAKLTAADARRSDSFGESVAISGDTAVIGASLDDDLGSASGSAYVFARDPLDPTLWTQAAKLTATDGAVGDSFGESVAISGDTAVIGARLHDDLGFFSGSAYVFRRILIDPALAVSGACPGELAFRGTGLTPRGRVELWGGRSEGSFTIPGGPCVGHELGIADARRLLRPGRADEEGGGSMVRTVAEGSCGARLQLLDLTSCAMTEVVPLP